MARYNDLDPKKWKEYKDINIDSLWIIDRRDNSGVHSGDYHGNFVPQLPRQLLMRYTKRGDWILDPFMGSGTSLIEAQRMGRNAIGIELQLDIALKAYRRIQIECQADSIIKVVAGDSRTLNMTKLMENVGIEKVQFVIMHPPYWDIIRFSDDEKDLSNSATLEEFLKLFGDIIDNTTQYPQKGRYCACVVGDKYANSQVIPLGFYCMNKFLEKGFLLKAILVKNLGETKGKAGKQEIWRYRAINSDFYIFRHEYIFIFKKR